MPIMDTFFRSISVNKHYKIYSLYNEVRKIIEIGDTTPNIERLFDQSVKFNIRLNDLIKNNQEPFFQKNKYIYLSELYYKLNNFITSYQKLLDLMTKSGGVGKKDVNFFIRNKENSTYRKSFKREGLDIDDILKQVDDIIKHINKLGLGPDK